jgi:hypothetical protein
VTSLPAWLVTLKAGAGDPTDNTIFHTKIAVSHTKNPSILFLTGGWNSLNSPVSKICP